MSKEDHCPARLSMKGENLRHEVSLLGNRLMMVGHKNRKEPDEVSV
jgi:hypothetical protein